jgi:hypothetical protein
MNRHTFCRLLLQQVKPDIEKHTTVEERQAAWVYDTGRKHHEFHGPDNFYWHGHACCAWEAKYQGWTAYLKHIGAEDYTIGEANNG